MTLKMRFRLTVGAGAIALAALATGWLHGEWAGLMSERKEQAENLVALPSSILAAHFQLELNGTLSRDQAQQRAIQEIRQLRYAGGNYFWITDMGPSMVMHPLATHLTGQSVAAYLDPDGKRLFQEMVRVVERNGSGFVTYRWPRPGHTAAVSKLSFVQGFRPWGWIVGTGIYVDDIERSWRMKAGAAGGLAACCLAALLLFSTTLARSVFRRLEDLVEEMRHVTSTPDDLAPVIQALEHRTATVADDEVAVVVAGVAEMLTQIRRRDDALRSHRERLESEVAARTAELSETHAELALFLESIPSILIGLDSAGRISRWNQTASATFGLEAAGVLGRPLDQCGIRWRHADMTGEIARWLQATTTLRCDEVGYEGADGIRFLGLVVRPIASATKGTVGIILTGADTTERRVLEEQLRQAQKLEAIGQLAAGIAHEINTPTQYVSDNTVFLKDSWEGVLALLEHCRSMHQEAALTGTISQASLARHDQLREELDLDFVTEQVPQAIEQSLEGLDRVAKIVRAMKEFSHPGSTDTGNLDLNHAIQTTVTVARSEWKHLADVRLQLEPALPPVPCNGGEVNQVLLNLVVNAAHAIRESQQAAATGKGTITIGTRHDGDWVEMTVRDTGAGIPSDIRARVFEPFFTTKGVGIGTGQGLALAHTVVVRKHRGQIWFDTETGKGTCFFVRLPLTAPSASQE